MGRKKVLEKRLQRLQNKLSGLRDKLKATEDVAEARALAAQIEDVNEDIQEVQAELDDLDVQDPQPGDEGADGGTDPEPAEPEPAAGGAEPRSGGLQVIGTPVASFALQRGAQQRRTESVLDSMEYREAFATYVRSGDSARLDALVAEKRADETLMTSDVGKIIPNTIMNEFIRDLKVYGNIYNRVRKLNVKGGVEFPIEELVPEVTWITESTVSETQKAPEINRSISFGYHICEARISQSLLSQVVTLAVLEQEIARLLAEAFIKEFDRVVLHGSGKGQPLGILNDSRVPEKQKISFTEEEIAKWQTWRTKLFAAVPLAYRGQGILVMTPSTWESRIMTLADDINRPLYQETYNPSTGTLECRFAGKEVVLVESDILKDFDTAGIREAWGLHFKPMDYAVNTNLQIGFKRWFDDDKNRYVNKGLCIIDGKLLDTHGVYILTKGGTSGS
ncbi:MAG: phage major capsid protein [Lachnospiraceae bacterium]|nr:phage major capsid protein [Lachnospiraceae bacterium]